MKILYWKGEPGNDYAEPYSVAADDGETISFEQTELAHAENDSKFPMEPFSATIYTRGGHFYVTLDKEDLLKIASLNLRHNKQAPPAMLPAKDLNFLGLAVMHFAATGDYQVWPDDIMEDQSSEERAHEAQLVMDYKRAIHLVANHIDVWNLLGALVQGSKHNEDL